MARQTTKSRKSSGTSRSNGRRASRSNGRRASQKPEKYRFAQNVDGQETVAEREYRSYATSDDAEAVGQDPDVLLDVPVVKVDRIHLKVEELEAHVALNAKVLDLVTLDVGVDVHLGKLELEIEGVEAQALVKVRLDHVAAIVDRTFTTIDRNPELTKSLGRAVEDIGEGAGKTLGETGEAVDDVGEGAGQAVEDVGQGAGQAVGQLGQGAGQAVEGVGQGAGQAVGNLDQLVGQLGQGVGQLGQGAGEAAGGLAEGAGQLGQGAGQLGQAAGQLGQGAGGGAGQTAKLLAKELGAEAVGEAKELGHAAAQKAKEMAEKRRRKRAEKLDATESALQLADELGVDLEDVEGTGAEGRITVRDVKQASRET